MILMLMNLKMGNMANQNVGILLMQKKIFEVLIGTTVNSKEELENQINQDNLLESLKELKYNLGILFYSSLVLYIQSVQV